MRDGKNRSETIRNRAKPIGFPRGNQGWENDFHKIIFEIKIIPIIGLIKFIFQT